LLFRPCQNHRGDILVILPSPHRFVGCFGSPSQCYCATGTLLPRSFPLSVFGLYRQREFESRPLPPKQRQLRDLPSSQGTVSTVKQLFKLPYCCYPSCSALRTPSFSRPGLFRVRHKQNPARTLSIR
jgi:hypothetical protein